MCETNIRIILISISNEELAKVSKSVWQFWEAGELYKARICSTEA